MILIELWSEGPGWKALGQVERAAWMERVNAAVAPVIGDGLTPVLAADLHAGSHAHLAVWRAADRQLIDRFLAALRGAGWYEVMNQDELIGDEAALERILASHLQGPGA